MFKKRILYTIISFLYLLLLINFSFSSNLEINIDEDIFAEQIDENQIDLEIKGTFEIDNQNKLDSIYQFEIIFDKDFIFDFKIENKSNNLTYEEDRILGREIFNNSKIEFNYQIYGILSNDEFEKYKEVEKTFLEYYIDEIKLDPYRLVSLSKLHRENADFVEISERNIVIDGINPTNFYVNFDYIKLFKSQVNTVGNFKSDENLLTTIKNIKLAPFENFTLTYLDKFSDDSSVYFIDYDVSVKYSINSRYSIEFHINDFLNKKNISNINDYTSYFKDNLIIQKYVSNNQINNLEEFEVKFKIQNPNPFSINNVFFSDSIPNKFELIKYNNLENIQTFLDLKPFETKTFSYNLKLDENNSDEMIFLPRANLDYDSKIIFSDSPLLINSFIYPEKKLLIKKEISPLEKNLLKISIRIENIGNTQLKNFQLTEDKIGINGTYMTGKSWNIDSLNSGEKWETSYNVELENANFFVPEIQIQEKEVEVLSTIIVNNEFILEDINSNPVDFYTQILISIFVVLITADLLF